MIEPEAHSEIRVSELQSLKIVITRRSILETTYLILKWTAERQKVEKVAVTTFVPQEAIRSFLILTNTTHLEGKTTYFDSRSQFTF